MFTLETWLPRLSKFQEEELCCCLPDRGVFYILYFETIVSNCIRDTAKFDIQKSVLHMLRYYVMQSYCTKWCQQKYFWKLFDR